VGDFPLASTLLFVLLVFSYNFITSVFQRDELVFQRLLFVIMGLGLKLF